MSNRGVYRGTRDQGARMAPINLLMDGFGGLIPTGPKGGIVLAFDAVIEWVVLEATDGNTGAMVMDLYRLTEAEWLEGIAAASPYSICTDSKPTISTGTSRYIDRALAGWQNELHAGDHLYWNVDSVTTITRATFAMAIRRLLT